MEKLVYLVFQRQGDTDEAFKQRLLDEVAPALGALGVSQLRINVVDDAVAAGAALHLGRMAPPPRGLLSFWMEQSQDCATAEQVFAPACGRIIGHLVVESRPLVNTEQQTPPGVRTPGVTIVSCLFKRADISRETFLRIWYQEQRACAIETQSTCQYVRNEVVRALTPDAPGFDAIVEETFPMGALTDPQVFFDAVGDDAKLEANRRRMIETCQKFLDLSRIESHPMSEYNF